MTGPRGVGPVQVVQVVVAPNAMRGHLDAVGVAAALARGAAGAGATVRAVPLADGGDGTLDLVARATGGTRRAIEVVDALGRPRRSEWLDLGTSALVESALCCGLAALRPGELDPLRSSSAGVGTAIRAAVRAGHRVVQVGLGGTAVVDGGAGALAELGVRFLDAAGQSVVPVPANLRHVVQIDLRPAKALLAGVRLRLMADVSSAYTANSRHFGAQKGLTEGDRPVAAAAMARLVDLARAAEPVGGGALLDARSGAPWWGAGGGTGLGLSTVAETDAGSGALAVREIVDPASLVTQAPLVITAEGVVDPSTWTGKAPGSAVAARRALGLPTVLVAARFTDDPQDDPLVARQVLAPGSDNTLVERLAAAGAAAWRRFATPIRLPDLAAAGDHRDDGGTG
ncbi:glycerate kinase [Pseudonocardia sp. TRM90224]|uniref:glycerate kinase n=1 Tax=Pseudonocardia sp. TRM90224 TaxID=2812678 RepID=UPI001E53D83C|nr:glycerate kinase [Pseudonocardia sp. TRM90224]